MTKRIVSGIFILTALGALGVILAGALTSGEQLIVRFLTAVIVAALGLYVISDLRLQADDDALTARTGGSNRVGTVDAPPNSTAAFMATVTRKGDSRQDQVAPATTGPLQLGETPAPEPTTRQQRALAGHHADATETTVVSAEDLALARDEVSKAKTQSAPTKTPAIAGGAPKVKNVPVKKQKPQVLSADKTEATKGPFETSIPSGAETVVASGSEYLAAPGHAMAGVGAVAASASGTGEVPGADGEGGPAGPSASNGPDAHDDFLGSQSIDISDLFADEGAKATFTTGNGGGSPTNGQNGWSNGGGRVDADHDNAGTNGNGTNGHKTNGTNGTKNGSPADGHISGRLSDVGESPVDPDALISPTVFDPTERVYDLEGVEAAALSDDEAKTSTDFQYSDDLNSGDHVWPAPPVTSAPEPHPFEKASAAYEAAKRKVEQLDEQGSDSLPVAAQAGLQTVEDDGPLAPIIDLRELADPGEDDVDAAIHAGEVEVIATLIEQGMLQTSGPVSDREVRTMVYVAFTSNELRKLLLAGGSPDGPNYGLDLGPVELFDERVHAPAPKRLYSGSQHRPASQIG